MSDACHADDCSRRRADTKAHFRVSGFAPIISEQSATLDGLDRQVDVEPSRVRAHTMRAQGVHLITTRLKLQQLCRRVSLGAGQQVTVVPVTTSTFGLCLDSRHSDVQGSRDWTCTWFAQTREKSRISVKELLARGR